ncbi:cytosine deaminase [Gottschalkia purinilytica]|uniref:Cytosine deaminase n=1 Tax=Gottschalkia purinilytica TaxID=1503 RepID=A0A0L0W7P8_GOTPU|nr:amidohydrolase [Gottschalkia purinilytica]KNF07564.1 cytosine deaminase [Gottschalkia purinilytica]
MHKINSDMIIRNCSILTEDYKIAENKSIVINDSRILDIDDIEIIDEKYKAEEILEGKKKLFMPGMVDAHTHTCQQLLRGRIMDEYPMIWKRIMVPYESSLNEKDISISAQLSCLEMIKSGTTSFIDAGGTYMHKVGEAVIESGLRAAITCSTMNKDDSIPKNMISTEKEAMERNANLYKNFHGKGNGRLEVWFSLRTLISCSPSLIMKAFENAYEFNTGIHVHMNEYPNEINYCLENYQKRPIEYLESLGILGPNFLSAHSILLSENEIDILRKYDVKVVHCPISNLGKGVPKTSRLLQSGVSISLGTDGTAHAGLSLFNEIKVFRSAMHINLGVPICDPVVMPARKLLEMATLGGAKAMLHGDSLGTLQIGKKADLISIDLDQPHIMPTHNMVNTLVEVVNSNDVKDMIVNGKLIMKNREVLTLDEERIMHMSKSALKGITDRAGI